MEFKNLILDLDNTLYEYDIAHKEALAKALEQFSTQFSISAKKTKESFDKARKKTHLELPNRAASHNRLLYFQKMLELNHLKSVGNAMKLYNCYWDTFLKKMELFDGVSEYLEQQQSKGIKICILTDLTAHIQYRKIEKLQLSGFIDFMVTSEEVGVEKPHPLMFMKALQKLECTPEDALMIGDSWSKDIVGASNMNIKSIWVNLKKEIKPILSGARTVDCFKDITL